MEKGHVCKFVICNNCKEQEDDKLYVKLGLTGFSQDALSSYKKISDCNDPLLHNHISRHIIPITDDTKFSAKYLKKSVNNKLSLTTICS